MTNLCKRIEHWAHCALVPPISSVLFAAFIPLFMCVFVRLTIMNMKPQFVDHILMNTQIELAYMLARRHVHKLWQLTHTHTDSDCFVHSFPIKSFRFLSLFRSFVCFQQRVQNPSLCGFSAARACVYVSLIFFYVHSFRVLCLRELL